MFEWAYHDHPCAGTLSLSDALLFVFVSLYVSFTEYLLMLLWLCAL